MLLKLADSDNIFVFITFSWYCKSSEMHENVKTSFRILNYILVLTLVTGLRERRLKLRLVPQAETQASNHRKTTNKASYMRSNIGYSWYVKLLSCSISSALLAFRAVESQCGPRGVFHCFGPQ